MKTFQPSALSLSSYGTQPIVLEILIPQTRHLSIL
jgi:hypothetical protein